MLMHWNERYSLQGSKVGKKYCYPPVPRKRKRKSFQQAAVRNPHDVHGELNRSVEKSVWNL
jgi:hypothetical protein